MVITKSPFRISFFGGSTDYESFYKTHGSFLIGTTINKYNYFATRFRPTILSKEHCITYSKFERVKTVEDIHNPLIKETLKFYQIDRPLELTCFSDIPSRTGLGGSSSFCVGISYSMRKLLNKSLDKKSIAKDAIYIERYLLKESGGIQDQIWASYGGFNSIEINTDGDFFVRPLPITEDFKNMFQNSIVLIYTNEQRSQNEIAQSYENKDKSNVLKLAKESYLHFCQENIQTIGTLLYESWMEKRKISPLISTQKIDDIIAKVMDMGAYGAKLAGTGGCGFIIVICNPTVKTKIIETFNSNVLDIQFEKCGVETT